MAIRLIQSLNHVSPTQKTRTAKIYYCPDWQEYKVKFSIDGVHLNRADAFFSSKDDAVDTARHFLFTEDTPVPRLAKVQQLKAMHS